jgi:hypothetical protein
LEFISPTGYIIRRGEIILKATESKSENHLGLKKKAKVGKSTNV